MIAYTSILPQFTWGLGAEEKCSRLRTDLPRRRGLLLSEVSHQQLVWVVNSTWKIWVLPYLSAKSGQHAGHRCRGRIQNEFLISVPHSTTHKDRRPKKFKDCRPFLLILFVFLDYKRNT